MTSTELTGLAPPDLAPDQKAAIILYSLGAERAEGLFRRMDESDCRRFAQAMNRLGLVDAATVAAVAAEFAARIGDGAAVRGGLAETRRFLARYLDEALADRIVQEVGGPPGRDIWEKLSNTPEQALFAYLRHEQSQSVAVILSRIRPEKAARVLQLFPAATAADVVLRMARLGRIDRSVMEEVKTALLQDFLPAVRREQGSRRPHDLIGGLLNRMPPDRTAPILETLRDHEPDLVRQVQRTMFTFADFGRRVTAAGLQAVIKNCERDTLLLALALARQTAPDVAERFFANMSKRVAEQMREEIQSAGPIRARDAQAAQQAIAHLAQSLAQSGEIEISDGEEEAEEEGQLLA